MRTETTPNPIFCFAITHHVGIINHEPLRQKTASGRKESAHASPDDSALGCPESWHQP